MKLESTLTNGTRHITLVGDFDAEGALTARDKIESFCADNEAQIVNIDMTHVPFLDSSGIGALVYLFKRLKASNCKMELSGVAGQPAELMKLLRVNQAITINWGDDNLQGLAV
ncbi:STAS domain-containing protein [Marinagarivorans cellulosilyticus]|uniref:STAS domain-containing protein n=1 Tax=Marinagarivorans cellulosilyticus TaxID=2721545 RepID=A0AAN1WIG8_9GAMM|nr:STAS domain-containing protein [Marinagarivorans cellulosilyticus]BCD98215.1 hypothetical protein MARGE09_P2416 [Marinagarivorans cellulosilyticus]